MSSRSNGQSNKSESFLNFVQSNSPNAPEDLLLLERHKILDIDSGLKALENPKMSTRVKDIICWVFAKMRVKRASRPLARFLEKGNAKSAMVAATALSDLDNRDVIQSLIRIVKRSPEEKRRVAAAYALSFMHAPRAPRVLLNIFRDESNSVQLRSQAAEGLGNHWYRTAFPDLIKGLKDRNASIRFWSIFALGQIGDRRALPYLKRIAKTDKAKVPGWWSIRKEARDMIRSIENRPTTMKP